MIEKALRYLNSLSAPNVCEINGETYSDKPLSRVKHNPKAEPIKLNTLTSLVSYMRSGVDRKGEKLFIHIQSPTKVSVFSGLDDDRCRETLVEVNAQIPSFDFDRFVEHEAFCIALQSKFLESPDRALLLKFAGTVEAGSISEYGDDGVSQKATIKTGIASKSEALVPSPVTLAPFRTFVEVEPPASSFIFRMKQDKYNNGVTCALFEADGGAWKNAAMEEIERFLKTAFEGDENLIVIS